MNDQIREPFLFNWRIKNYLGFDHEPERYIRSPTFRVENLGYTEWSLHIGISESKGKFFVCQLHLVNCDEILKNQEITVTFRIELVKPDGEIFKASELLTAEFRTKTYSEPYKLIEKGELKEELAWWSEDVITLRCYMASMHHKLPQDPLDTPVTRCEVETICYMHMIQCTWFLRFSDIKNWSVKKRLYMTNDFILKVAFNYIDDKIEIEISSSIKDECKHCISFDIELLNSSGTEIISLEQNKILSIDDTIWKYPSPICKQHLTKAECFAKKEIRLTCLFAYEYSSKVLHSTADADDFLHLQNDLSHLLADEVFTDIKLRADSEIFGAHKYILTARSPVFSAMFQQDMIENNTGVVDIPDVEAKILKLFLEYLYTCKISEMNEDTVLSLLLMADKYQVVSLVKKCSTFLESNMTEKYVCEVLLIADMVNNDRLKSSAMKYIVENLKNILSTKGWSKWAKNNVSLEKEIFSNIVKPARS